MTFNGTNSNGDERNLFVPLQETKWSYRKRHLVNGRTNEKSIMGTFTVVDEDHTLGQLMRHSLAKNPDVLSSGYIIPHPLENTMKIHCRTKDTTTPPRVMDETLKHTIHQLLGLRKQLMVLNEGKKKGKLAIT